MDLPVSSSAKGKSVQYSGREEMSFTKLRTSFVIPGVSSIISSLNSSSIASSVERLWNGSKLEASLDISPTALLLLTESIEKPFLKPPPISARSLRIPWSVWDGDEEFEHESEESAGETTAEDGWGARKLVKPRSWRLSVSPSAAKSSSTEGTAVVKWAQSDDEDELLNCDSAETLSSLAWRDLNNQDIVIHKFRSSGLLLNGIEKQKERTHFGELRKWRRSSSRLFRSFSFRLRISIYFLSLTLRKPEVPCRESSTVSVLISRFPNSTKCLFLRGADSDYPLRNVPE